MILLIEREHVNPTILSQNVKSNIFLETIHLRATKLELDHKGMQCSQNEDEIDTNSGRVHRQRWIRSSTPGADDGGGFEVHGLAVNLLVRERDGLAGLHGSPIVGEACTGIDIQAPEQLGVHEGGRRELPAVQHNVGNGAQVVCAGVDDLHFEAWNVSTGDLGLRDTDVGGMAASERTQLAIHCCPAFFLRNLQGG